jgi:hypothetical protein
VVCIVTCRVDYARVRASCEGFSEGRLIGEDRNVADTGKRNTERELGKVNANLEAMVMKA